MRFFIDQLRWRAVIIAALTAVVAVMVWGGPQAQAGQAPRIFDAILSGDAEVPPVETPANGTFDLSLEGDTLTYNLLVIDIPDITRFPEQAHIHIGPADDNGPVVAFLFGAVESAGAGEIDAAAFHVFRAQGTLVAAELIGPLEGMTIADLVAEIEVGNAYVNVHSEANPGGEVRGQIFEILPEGNCEPENGVGLPEPEFFNILTLNAGGQFLFWQFGPANAADVFGTVKIAWLFNVTAVNWTSFIPALGTVNFPLADGAVLWVVSETTQEIEIPCGDPPFAACG